MAHNPYGQDKVEGIFVEGLGWVYCEDLGKREDITVMEVEVDSKKERWFSRGNMVYNAKNIIAIQYADSASIPYQPKGADKK